MKKALFLALVLGFVVFFSISALAITIGFEPASQEVVVGDPASVNLVISGLGDEEWPSLGGFDLFIEYDPTILALSDVSFGDPTLGDQLAIGWGATYLSSTYSSSIEELLGLSFGPPSDLISSQAPSFVLAILTFDTLSVGTSPLEIVDPNPPFYMSRLSDELGEPLDFERESGSISPVPEPATFILIGFGLGGIGILRRKRRG